MKKGLIIFIPIVRITLGLVFLASGFAKCVDVDGFTLKISEHISAVGIGDIYGFSMGTAVLLILLEMFLGIALLIRLQMPIVSMVTVGLLGFFTLFSLYAAIYNPVPDCGCFGDAIKLSNWQSFAKNICLLVCGIILWKNNKLCSNRHKSKLSLLCFILIWCCAMVFINKYICSFWDFRSFHVGKNLRQSVLYDPDIDLADFSIVQLSTKTNSKKTEVEDVTDKILCSSGIHLFPIIQKINNEEQSQVKRFIETFRVLADKEDIPLLFLTSSNADDVKVFSKFGINNVGLVDGKILKTIVRENKGAIIISNGIIIGKWENKRLNSYPKSVQSVKKGSNRLTQLFYNSIAALTLLGSIIILKKTPKPNSV